MNEVKTLIDTAQRWNGYLEKKSNQNLDDFTANAGSGNYTCFARDYREHTNLNLQAQPWCAMYASEVFVQAFGLENARKLLCGALYHYCPTGVNQFKAAGQWSDTPEPGAVVFFTNGKRAYHTGIVVEVTLTRIKTIEGNTSSVSGVIENGGGVFLKSYARNYSKILGYGIPDWSIVRPVAGWEKDEAGKYRYIKENGEYAASEWLVVNHHWYYFNETGLMLTGWQKINGEWFYLDETLGGALEGACWHSRENGAMEIWEVE